MTKKLYNVLFLCTGNSARSIMAECILDRLAGHRFQGYSAGSHPKGVVNPYALALLKRLDHQTGGLRSKSWDEFARPGAPALDFVFTVCDAAAGEICPVWPGHPMTAHWNVPDPALAEGSDAQIDADFVQAYRMLERCIGVFVSLPFAMIDRLSLQRRLDSIGRIESAQETV